MSDTMVAGTPLQEYVASVSAQLDATQVETGHLDAYAVDAAVPDVAVAPRTIDELQAALLEAQVNGLHVIARGGGTHMGAGNCASEYDIALSLAGMNNVLAHEPADMTVTVEAGTRLVDLQRVLGAHGQFLPLDPPCDVAATVGGVLAANPSGPLRHRFGTARDWLIGIRVAHPDGSVSKSGGQVVKNVTGYDMHKLYVGSLGTLGVITQATFKLAPQPKADVTLAVECHTAREAARIIADAHDEGLVLHAAELLAPETAHRILGDARWTVVARVAGGAAAVARSVRDINAMAAVVGAHVAERETTVWDAWSSAFRPEALSLRIVVAPSAVADTIQVLDRQFIGAAGLLSATATAGVIRAQLHPTREARAHPLLITAIEIAARHDGFVVVDAAPMSLKRQIDVFGPSRPDTAIMRRLKDALDPRRTLSPGRFAGKL
jgi:glycolate oxidase FAD binding subunit